MIVGKNVFDQPINNNIKTYANIKMIKEMIIQQVLY